MTLDQLMAAARRQTLETSSSISDADLTLIINEGYRLVSVAERWPWLEASATFSVTSGTQEYDISADMSVSDFMWIRSVVFNADRDGMLDQLSFAQYLNNWGGDPDSGPRAYSFYLKNDDTVGLVPVPNVSGTNTYTLYYYKQPTVLSGGSSTPEWTSSLHQVLVDYAVSKLWEREEYFSERDQAWGKFVAGIGELKRFYKLRNKDRPIVFGDGEGGGMGGRRAILVENLPFG